MPRARINAQPPPRPRPGELPEEFQARRLIAKARLKAIKAGLKSAGLETYAAANKGRKNRDWRAGNGSADLAIIPDSLTLLGRSRQLVRDSWIARSLVRAFARNVVGKGINIVPNAKDRDGKPLTALNQKIAAELKRWAKSKKCDVEKRKSFGQMQRLAAKEKFTAGESLWMWSYKLQSDHTGRPDLSKPVGLSIQAFEAEQFDLRILNYEGREVRGGVEVDENGAPVAVHIYTRNPNDVLYRHAFFSERVAIERCFHYFEGERVLQSRGVTAMTPVMQDIRDLDRGKGAHLTRWLMEACVGAIIKTNQPVVGPQGLQSTIAPAANDPGQTNSGMTEADFVPGMVANLNPGEDIVPFLPTSPGGQYEPFTNLTVRGIGAGTGMSFGQVMRQADGNFSAARQDMLEDRKEWEPEHELIVDDHVRPTYELFVNFCALEGRFDGIEGFSMEEFLAERHRFVEADFIPPPQSWIDPEKEANGWILLLENRLITREEIAAMRGTQFYPMLRKIAAEAAESEEEGLSLPENKAEMDSLRELIKAILSNKLGTIDSVMANTTDFRGLAVKAGIPVQSNKTTQPLLPVVSPPGNLATGDPVKNADGKVIGGGVSDVPQPPPGGSGTPSIRPPVTPANPPGAPQAKPNGSTKKPKAPGRKDALDGLEIAPHGPNSGHQIDNPTEPFQQQARKEATNDDFKLPVLPVPSNVPNYRACADPVMACATCSFLEGEQCSRFGFIVAADSICDDWKAATLTENIGAPNTAKTFPPFGQGNSDLFLPSADPTHRA